MSNNTYVHFLQLGFTVDVLHMRPVVNEKFILYLHQYHTCCKKWTIALGTTVHICCELQIEAGVHM